MNKESKVKMDFLPLDADAMHALQRLARVWKTTPDKAALRLVRRWMKGEAK